MSKKLTFGITLAVGIALALAPGAAAGETRCMGLLTGTFDNVVVPRNQTCILLNTMVTGNVKALEDSRLSILGLNTIQGDVTAQKDSQFNIEGVTAVPGSTTVRGNVIGDKAEVAQLGNTGPVTVRGNIKVTEGDTNNPFAQDVFIEQTTVNTGNIKIEKMKGDILVRRTTIVQKGNIQVVENRVPLTATFAIQNNLIAQDLQVFKTRGEGDKSVENNTGSGNLQCFENDPPFDGTPNNYPPGKEEGQCPQ
jgi:hypothetical protein